MKSHQAEDKEVDALLNSLEEESEEEGQEEDAEQSTELSSGQGNVSCAPAQSKWSAFEKSTDVEEGLKSRRESNFPQNKESSSSGNNKDESSKLFNWHHTIHLAIHNPETSAQLSKHVDLYNKPSNKSKHRPDSPRNEPPPKKAKQLVDVEDDDDFVLSQLDWNNLDKLQ